METNVLAGERGQYRLMQPTQAIQLPATVQVMLARTDYPEAIGYSLQVCGKS